MRNADQTLGNSQTKVELFCLDLMEFRPSFGGRTGVGCRLLLTSQCGHTCLFVSDWTGCLQSAFMHVPQSYLQRNKSHGTTNSHCVFTMMVLSSLVVGKEMMTPACFNFELVHLHSQVKYIRE
jgi:hypothetical protein